MKKSCVVCESEFDVRGKRKETARYCSLKCKGIGSRKPESIRICRECGDEFYAKGNPVKYSPLYCSRKCAGIGRTIHPELKMKCEWCGDGYKTKRKQQRFCSYDCQNKWQQRNKVKFVCKICNKDFFKSKSVVEQRDYEIKFCSIPCRNKDLEWQKAPIKANLVQQDNKGLNKLELEGRTILEDLGAEFDEQVLLFDKFLVDVVIPDKKIVIQWDGDYWHGHTDKLDNNLPDKRQKKRMNLDKSQDTYMKKCGYKVLRFWENEIKNNRGYVYENIKRAVQ